MNNVLFDLYKDSITENFINALSESVFNDKNEILGVENNDWIQNEFESKYFD